MVGLFVTRSLNLQPLFSPWISKKSSLKKKKKLFTKAQNKMSMLFGMERKETTIERDKTKEGVGVAKGGKHPIQALYVL